MVSIQLIVIDCNTGFPPSGRGYQPRGSAMCTALCSTVRWRIVSISVWCPLLKKVRRGDLFGTRSNGNSVTDYTKLLLFTLLFSRPSIFATQGITWLWLSSLKHHGSILQMVSTVEVENAMVSIQHSPTNSSINNTGEVLGLTDRLCRSMLYLPSSVAAEHDHIIPLDGSPFEHLDAPSSGQALYKYSYATWS